jgi:hypothetical protein
LIAKLHLSPADKQGAVIPQEAKIVGLEVNVQPALVANKVHDNLALKELYIRVATLADNPED